MSMVFSLQQPTVNNTIGAIFLGLIGSAFLDGITTLQMFMYYHNLVRDSFRHKAAVALLWFLDIFHLALTIHAVYVYIVTGWGNSLGLSNIVWSLKLQVAINVVIVVLVQSLYASRVWILGGYHNGFLGYLAAAVVGGGFIIGTVLTYKVYTIRTFSNLDSISWAITASLATATTIDLIIAVAMCYYLWKSKGSEWRLNSKISKLMQFTLSSGLLTSACSLTALFTYLLIPNTFIFLGIEFLLTKLYVGSFFAMLNARERPKESTPPSEQSGNAPMVLPYTAIRTPPWGRSWAASTRPISR